MTSRKSHKQRGATYESDIRDYMRALGHIAERLSRTGKNDEGDVSVVASDGHVYVFECKAPGASNRIDLSGWTKEAQTERINYAKVRSLDLDKVFTAVLIKARGKSIADSYLVFRLGDYFGEP